MPDTLTFTSVHNIPGANASAAFTSKTSEVFKEEHNIAPIIINDKMKYIPWGGDNQMPYNIIDLIESDETMSTCQMFNAEVCYGSGLVYDTELATAQEYWSLPYPTLHFATYIPLQASHHLKNLQEGKSYTP